MYLMIYIEFKNGIWQMKPTKTNKFAQYVRTVDNNFFLKCGTGILYVSSNINQTNPCPNHDHLQYSFVFLIV